jgi:hypothetical protein
MKALEVLTFHSSQCIPGTATTSIKATTTKAATTKAQTTTSKAATPTSPGKTPKLLICSDSTTANYAVGNALQGYILPYYIFEAALQKH